ncbi:NAD(P)-binding protein [Peniophora sp. CONT]|nr:NAD(P)-binding protein [Peniophora sp. CONT]
MPNISVCRQVLVIGATAGLGRALSLAIRDLPSSPRVVVAGRRLERLEELGKEERIDAVQLDVAAPREKLIQSVNDVLKKFPDIDCVIFSAGIQRQIDFTKPETVNLDFAEAELNTNFLAIITMIAKCFIPHFQALDRAAFIMPISSGLALQPKSNVPVYCASKAAVHSFAVSLGKQLKDAGSKISVVEIMPPLVESELHDHEGTTEALSKFWVPLDVWTKDTISDLTKMDGNGISIASDLFKPMYEKYEKEKLKGVQ